ncbi:MAG: hypothetical protein HOE62_04455 [Alphaproteobacteria bacterium]|jgi:hypothetical protein|nr:hypothetical protein [Alphaproteobacteria bacterium]MBT4017175.1 hypothetical protein [Alphaproteobacteria bacterium]MBT5159176.1 hypothetical protein [Alphaproteobacteria bacterium]MBT5917107.1 hypothetical protein [Alphaproteobacteria bacterium]MBT6384775.1 hypothetical protein [Alphaproteobacteria bacterium]
MTIQINLPDDQSMATVQEHFADEDNVRQTLTAMREAEPTIAFSRLWRFASGEVTHDADLLTALRHDSKLAADVNALLQKISWSHLPQAAAASTDEDLRLRETDLCAIRIESSRAEPDQVYVIIELKDAEANAPRTLITSAAGGTLERLELPAAQGGVIQVLLQHDDAVLIALRDHGTEVFLR